MTKGRWGRRVWGEVHRGSTYTRFHLQITIENGCDFFETLLISNLQLKSQPLIYGWTLDEMTKRLAKRVDERLL